MDKRYQVFLSSTFADLEDERKEVISALQKAGYFVAGMELFPSDDDESWEVIKRVIDQSDYYVLVIGGRYGSIGNGGKSFTEMEYDYAKSQGKPVLPFVHTSPDDLPGKKIEKHNPEKLAKFRKKIEKLHSRRSWTTKFDLATEVLASISQTVVLRPQIGWVRGDAAVRNAELLQRLEGIQKRYEAVREERDSLSSLLEDADDCSDLAWGEDTVPVKLKAIYDEKEDREPDMHTFDTAWNTIFDTIFDAIAPRLIGWKSRTIVGKAIVEALFANLAKEGNASEPKWSLTIDEDFLTSVRSQLVSLDLITVDVDLSEGGHWYNSKEIWRLTEKGLQEMSLKKAVKRADRSEA